MLYVKSGKVVGIAAWIALNRLQGFTKGATALLQGEHPEGIISLSH